jgi:hypothetical protein
MISVGTIHRTHGGAGFDASANWGTTMTVAMIMSAAPVLSFTVRPHGAPNARPWDR